MKDEPSPRGRLEWHKRYDNIDGTGEMLMGLMCLAFGLLSYLQSILPKDSIWSRNFFCMLLFMYAVLVLVMGPGYWVGKIVKQRITFPRTGYVAGHSLWRLMLAPKGASADAAPGVPTRKALWQTVLAIGLLSAIVAAGFAYWLAFEKRHLGAMTWPVGAGYVGYLGFWVPLYAFWVWRMGPEHRWKWLVLLLMGLGLLVIGLVGPGNIVEGARPVMLFVGFMWVISGLVTLFLYLRHTSPAAAEAQ